MSIIKSIAAKTLDWAVKKAGSNTLDLARNIVPLPVKRRISRLLTKEIKISQEYVDSQDGHKFVAIQEPVFLQVRYEGTYEKDLSEVSKQLISKGDNVVDVGANFGWYSILMASAVGDKGQVFSYEPNDTIYSVLERNIDINNYKDRITLTKCGIGEQDEQAFLSAGDAESAIGYFDKTQTKDTDNPEAEGIEIHPLDDLMADKIGQISFVKVDVEGFEPFVLRGAKKIFSSDNPPAMLMEFNIEALERQDLDIDGFIKELTALPATIAKTVQGKLVKMDGIPKENANLFFLPNKGQYKRDVDSITLS